MNPQQNSPIMNSPISNYQDLQNLSTTQPQAAAQPQQSGGNFLERLLPTIGSVGGGILGSFASPFLGTAAGAGLGEAAGKAVENALTGQSIGSGVGSDALSGAASGLLGAGLGKVAEGAGGLLSKFGENAAANTDREAQAAKNASDVAAQGKQDVLNQQITQANYGVMNDKLQRQWDLGSNQKFVDQMGLDSTNPYNMQKVAQAGGELNTIVDQALKQAPEVSVSDAFANALQHGTGEGLRIDIGNTPVGRALTKAGIDPAQDIPRTLPATTVRKLMQSVGDEVGNSQRFIQNALDNGVNPTEEQTNLSDLQDIYKNLRDKLANNESVNSAIKNANISPELRDQWTQQYGKPLTDYLTTTINNAQNYDGLVPEMQKFAKMGHASNLAVDDIENAPATTRAVQRVKLGAQQGQPVTLASAQVANDAADHLTDAAGHIINGDRSKAIVSALKAAKSASPSVAKRMGDVLTRTAPFVPSATVGAGTLGGLGAGGNNDMQNVSNTMQQQANPLSELVQANMAQDILAPGPYGSSAGSFLGTMAPQMQKSQMAQSIVNNLLGAYGGAGGAQGFGGGVLSRLSGFIPGTAANAFQQRSGAAAAQLSQLLGITPEAAQGLLPQLMQNSQTGGQATAGLGGLVGALPL